MHSEHILARVFALEIVLKSEKAHTNHQTLFAVFERVDPLLRLCCGLALPLCWGLIAVLIGLFLTQSVCMEHRSHGHVE